MTSHPRHIIVRDHQGVLILEVVDKQLSGEAQVDDWRSEMVDTIRRASPPGVVIDMKNVEYLTSIALFPLIATKAAAEELGARVVLCNLSETVAKILTVSQLIVESRPHAKHLAMANTLEDALSMFER